MTCYYSKTKKNKLGIDNNGKARVKTKYLEMKQIPNKFQTT